MKNDGFSSKENKKIISNIFKVAFSNIIKLLSGVLVGFLLPKIIGVTDYGFYKTFTLYITYVGLFHFGIADGIYLKYGGMSYDELDKNKFKFYSQFFIFLECILSIIMLFISLSFISGEYKFIFSCVAIYLLCNNVTGYFQMISQITSRFNELSIRNIIQSLLTITAVLSLYFLYKYSNYDVTYKIYTLMYIGIIFILSLWYIFTYRKIVFGSTTGWKNEKKDIWLFIKIGFPLLIANLCSTFILTLDRQFVNIIWPVTDLDNTYSIYAFAYNMLSLVTTATTAISTVIYPTLKKTTEETLKHNYSRLISIILIFVFFAMIAYYPLVFIVNNFLAKYNDSLIYFRIIFPGLACQSAITIIMHNYYKVLGYNFKFFIKGIVTIVISFVANLIAYLIFKTPLAISVASIITMLIWYFYVEYFFVKKYKVKTAKNIIYMVISMGIFYGVTFIENVFIGFGIHIISYLLVTYLFFCKDINNFIKSKFKKKSKENQLTKINE